MLRPPRQHLRARVSAVCVQNPGRRTRKQPGNRALVMRVDFMLVGNMICVQILQRLHLFLQVKRGHGAEPKRVLSAALKDQSILILIHQRPLQRQRLLFRNAISISFGKNWPGILGWIPCEMWRVPHDFDLCKWYTRIDWVNSDSKRSSIGTATERVPKVSCFDGVSSDSNGFDPTDFLCHSMFQAYSTCSDMNCGSSDMIISRQNKLNWFSLYTVSLVEHDSNRPAV